MKGDVHIPGLAGSSPGWRYMHSALRYPRIVGREATLGFYSVVSRKVYVSHSCV